MFTTTHSLLSRSSLAGALLASALVGCRSSSTPTASTPQPQGCRDGLSGEIRNTGRVAGQGIEEGAEVGVAGVKQAVKATGGFISDGREGADREWEEGKVKTDQEKADGRQERKAVNLPPCP